MKKLNKKVVGAVLVVGILLTAGLLMQNKNKLVEVEVAAAKKEHIAEYVEELGLVVSETKGNVFAPAAGKVTEVMVEVGDQVEKGDVVAKIDNQQLASQLMEMEAKKAAIMAQYNEAVKPIDRKEIEKLELQLGTQKKKVEEAKRQSEIHKTLFEADAISYEEYHVVLLSEQQEEARLEAINLDLELIKKPISQNIAASYKAQLKQIDIQMEQLRKDGQNYVVTSPLRGTVMMKTAETGSYLQPGMQMMEIGDAEALYIESDVLVSEIAKIEEGSKVEVSHKDLGISGATGTIRKIYPKAFSKVSDLGIEQKRIKIEIAIEGKIEGLRPGYDLDLKIIVSSKENAVVIPENAVFEKNGKHYVFVNEKGAAALREVQKGIESRKKVEIISGLSEGEEVILSPDEKLEEGILIHTKEMV